jgi:hypothetical protein
MVHWYFDEKLAVEPMRETQRAVEQAWAWGVFRPEQPPGWWRARMRLGRWLIALGQSLQQGRGTRGAEMASSSRCRLR